jgi:hypothetical protein
MEIEFKAGKLMIRVHGNSGKRTVVLPFSVRAGGQYGEVSLASAGRGTRVSIQYQSSGNDLTGNTTGYTEYVFAVK